MTISSLVSPNVSIAIPLGAIMPPSWIVNFAAPYGKTLFTSFKSNVAWYLGGTANMTSNLRASYPPGTSRWMLGMELNSIALRHARTNWDERVNANERETAKQWDTREEVEWMAKRCMLPTRFDHGYTCSSRNLPAMWFQLPFQACRVLLHRTSEMSWTNRCGRTCGLGGRLPVRVIAKT